MLTYCRALNLTENELLWLNCLFYKVGVTKLKKHIRHWVILHFIPLLYFLMVVIFWTFFIWKQSLCVRLTSLTPSFHTAPQGVVNSIWTHGADAHTESHKDAEHILQTGLLKSLIYCLVSSQKHSYFKNALVFNQLSYLSLYISDLQIVAAEMFLV